MNEDSDYESDYESINSESVVNEQEEEEGEFYSDYDEYYDDFVAEEEEVEKPKLVYDMSKCKMNPWKKQDEVTKTMAEIMKEEEDNKKKQDERNKRKAKKTANFNFSNSQNGRIFRTSSDSTSGKNYKAKQTNNQNGGKLYRTSSETTYQRNKISTKS